MQNIFKKFWKKIKLLWSVSMIFTIVYSIILVSKERGIEDVTNPIILTIMLFAMFGVIVISFDSLKDAGKDIEEIKKNWNDLKGEK